MNESFCSPPSLFLLFFLCFLLSFLPFFSSSWLDQKLQLLPFPLLSLHRSVTIIHAHCRPARPFPGVVGAFRYSFLKIRSTLFHQLLLPTTRQSVSPTCRLVSSILCAPTVAVSCWLFLLCFVYLFCIYDFFYYGLLSPYAILVRFRCISFCNWICVGTSLFYRPWSKLW